RAAAARTAAMQNAKARKLGEDAKGDTLPLRTRRGTAEAAASLKGCHGKGGMRAPLLTVCSSPSAASAGKIPPSRRRTVSGFRVLSSQAELSPATLRLIIDHLSVQDDFLDAGGEGEGVTGEDEEVGVLAGFEAADPGAHAGDGSRLQGDGAQGGFGFQAVAN